MEQQEGASGGEAGLREMESLNLQDEVRGRIFCTVNFEIESCGPQRPSNQIRDHDPSLFICNPFKASCWFTDNLHRLPVLRLLRQFLSRATTPRPQFRLSQITYLDSSTSILKLRQHLQV